MVHLILNPTYTLIVGIYWPPFSLYPQICCDKCFIPQEELHNKLLDGRHPASTSWYGKYLIIYRVLYIPGHVPLGIINLGMVLLQVGAILIVCLLGSWSDRSRRSSVPGAMERSQPKNGSMKKRAPFCLFGGFVGDEKLPKVMSGLFHKPWNKDTIIKQPGFNGT